MKEGRKGKKEFSDRTLVVECYERVNEIENYGIDILASIMLSFHFHAQHLFSFTTKKLPEET